MHTPTIQFQCLPPGAFVTQGDLTTVREADWRAYLQAEIHSRFPWYAAQAAVEAAPARQENDCILTSLSEYLLDQHRIVVPRDSLFRVYNHAEQGLLIGDLAEAISAVIEPLGFCIDRILAPDPELRRALRHPRAVGLNQATAFDGRPGIAMINIKPGYSHAFYWPRMDAAKFAKDQFRLAVLVKRSTDNADFRR